MPFGQALRRELVGGPAEEPLVPGQGGVDVSDGDTGEYTIHGMSWCLPGGGGFAGRQDSSGRP
jgi:hypothetical protein